MANHTQRYAAELAPSPPTPAVAAPTNNTLWAGRRIPILGITGEFGAGKTYFAATIDPKNTLYLDLEMSAVDYESLGFERRDIRMLTAARLAGNGTLPEPLDVYNTFWETVSGVKPGQYKVIVVDPISGTLENGMTEKVAQDYAKHGFRSKAAFEGQGGIFWSTVKAYWEEVLFFITARCETFVFIAHQREVWKDNRPTGEREAAGKNTLRQLANLYLYLDRKPRKKGDAPPLIPAAHVEKGRTMQAFPPRLPRATPDAIRYYIQHPADFAALTDDELVIETELSEADRLRLTAVAEEARRDAAATELETVKQQHALLSARELAKQRAGK